LKRFISIDGIRGFAIILVIFFHALMYNIDLILDDVDTETNFITQLLAYFLYWAPAFTLISGTSNALSIYGRYKRGKLQPKQMLKNLVLSGFIIIGLNYVYMIFFTPGHVEPDFVSIGIFPGFFRYGELYITDLARLTFTTTLIMLGTSNIVLGIVFYILFRKKRILTTGTNSVSISNSTDDLNNSKQEIAPNSRPDVYNYIIVGIFAMLILILYPVIKELTLPILTTEVTPTNFVLITLISWIAGNLNPMFPYASFALFGAIFGMMIVDKQSNKYILSYGYLLGGIITIIGLILYSFYGFVSVPYNTPPLPSMILIMGPIVLIFTMVLHRDDFSGEKNIRKAFKRTQFSRRLGMISLTIFMWESSLSYLVGALIGVIYPTWRANYAFMFFIFSPLMVLIWFIIVRLWEKREFKGSIEWIMIILFQKVSKKKTIKLDVKNMLYNVDAYLK
jgi:Heparan-alpha-glucosaminide N-acetyltransferase, catalytic